MTASLLDKLDCSKNMLIKIGKQLFKKHADKDRKQLDKFFLLITHTTHYFK